MRTNFTKLMDYNSTSYRSPFIHFNMPTKCYKICKDNIIPNNTIMCDMNITHQEHVTSYFCSSVGGSSLVDCYGFTNCYIVPNLYKCLFASIFKILRDFTNCTIMKNLTIFTNCSSWLYSGKISN